MIVSDCIIASRDCLIKIKIPSDFRENCRRVVAYYVCVMCVLSWVHLWNVNEKFLREIAMFRIYLSGIHDFETAVSIHCKNSY